MAPPLALLLVICIAHSSTIYIYTQWCIIGDRASSSHSHARDCCWPSLLLLLLLLLLPLLERPLLLLLSAVTVTKRRGSCDFRSPTVHVADVRARFVKNGQERRSSLAKLVVFGFVCAGARARSRSLVCDVKCRWPSAKAKACACYNSRRPINIHSAAI